MGCDCSYQTDEERIVTDKYLWQKRKEREELDNLFVEDLKDHILTLIKVRYRLHPEEFIDALEIKYETEGMTRRQRRKKIHEVDFLINRAFNDLEHEGKIVTDLQDPNPDNFFSFRVLECP